MIGPRYGVGHPRAASGSRLANRARRRLKASRGDADTWVVATRRGYLLSACVVAAAVLVYGCGLGGSSADGSPTVPHVSEISVARNQAAQMVLTTGYL